MPLSRDERLQIMLTEAEMRRLNQWRFSNRMPTKAAAIRELLRRGLHTEGFDIAPHGIPSKRFAITDE